MVNDRVWPKLSGIEQKLILDDLESYVVTELNPWLTLLISTNLVKEKENV